MRVHYDNWLDDYTIVASSEAANLPATNLQDTRLSQAWRSTGDSAEWIKVDAGIGLTLNPTCLGIAGHNLSSGATIKLQGNATDVWTAPTVDSSVTWRSGTILHFFTGQALRFWRVSLVDASNPDGYIQIGRLSLGTYVQTPTVGAEPSVSLGTSTKVSESLSGQLYSDIGIIWREIEIDFPPSVTVANRDAFNTIWENVHNGRPVFAAVFDATYTVEGPLYCRIDAEHVSWRRGAGGTERWSTSLKLREVF